MASREAQCAHESRSDQKKALVKRVIVVATVLVGIPAVFALWFGLLLLADHLGVEAQANEVLAGIIAAVTALVQWPLGTHRLYRSFRRKRVQSTSVFHPRREAQTPHMPLTFSDACGRAITVFVGACTLFLLCGSQQFMMGVQGLIAVGSSGPRSAWMLLQILTGILTVALLFPTLWLTGRALRGTQPGSPEHLQLALRQDWYAAATITWVLSLMTGFLFSTLCLTLL